MSEGAEPVSTCGICWVSTGWVIHITALYALFSLPDGSLIQLVWGWFFLEQVQLYYGFVVYCIMFKTHYILLI